MHISITAEVARLSSPRPSILRKAEIMASGFLVSSTDPASARNSRERDKASRTSCDSAQASAISATASRTTRMAPPPEFLRSPPLSGHAEKQGGDHTRDDHGDHHHLHVAVADVGQFVAEHRLDLPIVQRVEKACRDGDRVLL